MSVSPELDTMSFPGGYDLKEIIAVVKLAAMQHVEHVPVGPLDQAIASAFLEALLARNPTPETLRNPYQVRAGELFDERRSLLHSHLGMSWFTLAYWAYGLIAVRSGVSVADHDGVHMFVVPVRQTLQELGVRVSEAECLEEVDRFLPVKASPRSVEASTHTFLSFVRFLHRAALRRRRVVTPELSLPGVALAYADEDAEQADSVTRFLSSHGVTRVHLPQDVASATRLLVLLSREAIGSASFWRGLARWKERPVIPMVLCLMPKAELYCDPSAGVPADAWAWLGDNVAVTLGSENDRYGILLRALDAPDPKQWWWNEGDTMEIGLAVDVLGEGIPRPATRRGGEGPAAGPYPFCLDGEPLSACVLASERATRGDPAVADLRYVEACDERMRRRQRPCGEPYALPWFVVAYRAWLVLAGVTDHAAQVELELRAALFALGIGSQPAEVPAFLDGFARLPWGTPPSSIAAIDERTVAFLVLVHQLSQAALTRGQRVRLQHPACPCFISYARPDEAFAREFASHLEAKGADVWWDVHAMTLGTPLDASLRSAVAEAKVLFLSATPAAARSEYVRLEVETAIRQGLRIVPMAAEGRLPAELQSWQACAPDSFDPPVVVDADRAAAFAAALARLQRTPQVQLRWLQSQAAYHDLRSHLSSRRAPRAPV